MSLHFVKYECGCIGFPPETDQKNAWILDPCNKESEDPLCFYKRDITKLDGKGNRVTKIFTSLLQPENDIFIKRIQRQLADGEAFQKIQALLARPMNPL